MSILIFPKTLILSTSYKYFKRYLLTLHFGDIFKLVLLNTDRDALGSGSEDSEDKRPSVTTGCVPGLMECVCLPYRAVSG